MIQLKKSILVGVIGAAHGIKGAARIKSFTQDPMSIGDYGALHNGAGRFFVLHPLRLHQNIVIAHIDGITSREQVICLRGTKLYLERAQLPETQEEDEFYWQDLIGLRVVCLEGKLLGCVGTMFNFGGGDVLEIKSEQFGNHLIPFSRAAVPVVDLTKQQIVVDVKAAGLSFPDKDKEANKRR